MRRGLAVGVAVAAVLVVGVPGAAGVGSTGGQDTPATAVWAAPVRAPVVAPFHLPRGQYGPGTRGLRYGTTPGQPVTAVSGGTVAFAGQVAGHLAVSVEHQGGVVSSLTFLAALEVTDGQLVARGQLLGTAGTQVHLGVRVDGRYVDPATLLGARSRARLVPARDGQRGAFGATTWPR